MNGIGTPLLDELRRVELAVVEGERQLAEQEALLVSLKKGNSHRQEPGAILEIKSGNQQLREQDRRRLLSLLQS